MESVVYQTETEPLAGCVSTTQRHSSIVSIL